MKTGTVSKEIILNATTDVVWDYLTNPKLTKLYFFECEVLSDFKTGSTISFKMNQNGKEIIAVTGIVKKIENNKELIYTCFAPDFKNDKSKHTVVRMQLSDNGNNTTLNISQGSFGDDIDRYNQTNQGWDYVLNGLKKLLE